MKKIKEQGYQDDLYWIYLNDGWCNQNGEHSIAEETKQAAIKQLKTVVKCKCKECAP